MKQIFSAIFLIVMQTVLTTAQPAFPPRERDMVKDLKAKLKLTDEQAKKVESIFDNDKKKMKSLFDNKQSEPEKMRKTMDSLMNTTNKEIEKVLNSEQKEKFKKMLKERKNEMNNMPPSPPQGRFDMERGILPPPFLLGDNGRINMCPCLRQPGMQDCARSHKDRSGRNKNMHTRCGCMGGEGFMPPSPPDRFAEEIEEDMQLLDDFFEM